LPSVGSDFSLSVFPPPPRVNGKSVTSEEYITAQQRHRSQDQAMDIQDIVEANPRPPQPTASRFDVGSHYEITSFIGDLTRGPERSSEMSIIPSPPPDESFDSQITPTGPFPSTRPRPQISVRAT
jgi:hypothetical protein